MERNRPLHVIRFHCHTQRALVASCCTFKDTCTVHGTAGAPCTMHILTSKMQGLG